MDTVQNSQLVNCPSAAVSVFTKVCSKGGDSFASLSVFSVSCRFFSRFKIGLGQGLAGFLISAG